MEMPSFSRRGGGVLDGLKDRFGFGSSSSSSRYQDDYDDYAETYDDYDDGSSDVGSDYDRYDSVTTRSAGTNRMRTSSYTARASSSLSERRNSLLHPPLINADDVRASTKAQEGSYTTRRRTSSFRNSVGRASDYTPSGAEIDGIPALKKREEEQAAAAAAVANRVSQQRQGGYNALFDSSPTTAALTTDRASSSYAGQSSNFANRSAMAATAAAATAAATSAPREVKVISPVEYGEVEPVARELKAGNAVVLTLRNTPNQLSKRVLDFSFGVASALDARVDCIADKVFAITHTQALTEEETKSLRAKGVL